MNQKLISGRIDFHHSDLEIITGIFGDTISSIKPSDYVIHRVARFENPPEAVLDQLDLYWGQFVWILD